MAGQNDLYLFLVDDLCLFSKSHINLTHCYKKIFYIIFLSRTNGSYTRIQ